MEVNTLKALYLDMLRDLYDAEGQLVEALGKVEKKVLNKDLKKAVTEHLKITKDQQSRLRKLFKEHEEDPKGKTCAAMEGLVKEAEEMIEEVEDAKVLDAALIGAMQKVEHYEIASYGTARTFAQLLGNDEDAEVLQSILDEEYAADDMLTEIAESIVNERAMEAESEGKSEKQKTAK